MLKWLINYSNRMKFCPDTILIQCNKCGKTHELKVIKIFSNWYKGKYVTWCSNKHKFGTLYYCGKTKN